MSEVRISRKWKAFKAVMILEFTATVVGIVKFAIAPYDKVAMVTGFIVACFSAIAGTLAFYFAANVYQKDVVSKNYNKELANN